jgi:hypothetical protein
MMAILDARLLPLIEALTTANADWLAFEIVDELRLGQVPEETREDLQRTRNAVRSVKRSTRRSEERAWLPLPELPSAPVPILGDEQIDWAANYVAKRMSDAVLMLETTLDQLEQVVSGTPTVDRDPSGTAAKPEITLVLQTHDQGLSVSRDDAAHAAAALPKLHEALLAWVASTRRGGVSE